MKINRFEELECWQSARETMRLVYITSQKNELKHELEFKSQFLRAGLSVMNNIAEGFGRYHSKDFIRSLKLANASGNELRSMSYVLVDQNFVTSEEQLQLLEATEKTQKLAGGLIRYLVKSGKTTKSNDTSEISKTPEHLNP